MIDFRIAIAAAALVTAPAIAAPAPPAADNTVAAAQTAAVAQTAVVDTPSAQGRPTRYCIAETFTGSHIKRKVCKTRAEWMDMGMDPAILR